MVCPLCLVVWQHVKLSDFSLGTRPVYNLVVDGDVKKPNKHTVRIWKLPNHFLLYVDTEGKKVEKAMSIHCIV